MVKQLNKVELWETYYGVSSLSPGLRGKDTLRARVTKGTATGYKVYAVNDVDEEGKLIKTNQVMVEFLNMANAYFFAFATEEDAKQFISENIATEDRTIHAGNIQAADSITARLNEEKGEALAQAIHADSVDKMVTVMWDLEADSLDAAIDQATKETISKSK